MSTRELPGPRPLRPASRPTAAAAPLRPLGRDRPATVGGRPVGAAGGAAASPLAGSRSAGVGRPARPDPRPMRLAVAAGGLAALSALVATVATSAVPVAAQVVTVHADNAAEVPIVRHVTRVITLPPGATAPPASVNTIVTQLPAPIVKPRTVVVTTTQSGQVVKP